jgi:hypothetical protein
MGVRNRSASGWHAFILGQACEYLRADLTIGILNQRKRRLTTAVATLPGRIGRTLGSCLLQ